MLPLHSASISLLQMVYSATTEIGCAYKICGNIMQIFCLYDEIGAITGTILYESGKACEQPQDCITYTNSSCYNKLCVKPDEVPGKKKHILRNKYAKCHALNIAENYVDQEQEISNF
ncbi:hypothetical protein ANCDUO_09744 [Ancylostoma duodenale]|uniref:SCP domain-containing protein n=1 Tax=Ancylostoma duodenale TaxID=51022 RepID=A0A0C2GSH2_9BILA|nr:hypothetical protein ANCDUO_09744 [Ancylostoma duodenale]